MFFSLESCIPYIFNLKGFLHKEICTHINKPESTVPKFISWTNCDHMVLSRHDLEILFWSTQASGFSPIFPYLQNNMPSSSCLRHLKADGPLTAA